MSSQAQQNKHESIEIAMLHAQRDVTAFVKDAKNDHHNFAYSSADGIVSTARDAMHKHGLTVQVLDTDIKMLDREAPAAVLTVKIKVDHPDSKGSLVVSRSLYTEAGKGRPLDRALLGAETSTLAYALRGLLLAPRFDLDEINDRNDAKYDPSTIGTAWVDSWLKPMCKRLAIEPDMLRAKLIHVGEDRAMVAKATHLWPIAWKPQIKQWLLKHAQDKSIEPVADEGDLSSLPQRPADESTLPDAGAGLGGSSPAPAPVAAPTKSNGTRKAVSA